MKFPFVKFHFFLSAVIAKGNLYVYHLASSPIKSCSSFEENLNRMVDVLSML